MASRISVRASMAVHKRPLGPSRGCPCIQTPAAVPAPLLDSPAQATRPCPRPPPAARGISLFPSYSLHSWQAWDLSVHSAPASGPLESSPAAPTTFFKPCLLAAHVPAVGAPWPPHQEGRPARRRKPRVGEGCAPAILPTTGCSGLRRAGACWGVHMAFLQPICARGLAGGQQIAPEMGGASGSLSEGH
jgi:hypothetical protein